MISRISLPAQPTPLVPAFNARHVVASVVFLHLPPALGTVLHPVLVTPPVQFLVVAGLALVFAVPGLAAVIAVLVSAHVAGQLVLADTPYIIPSAVRDRTPAQEGAVA